MAANGHALSPYLKSIDITTIGGHNSCERMYAIFFGIDLIPQNVKIEDFFDLYEKLVQANGGPKSELRYRGFAQGYDDRLSMTIMVHHDPEREESENYSREDKAYYSELVEETASKFWT